MAVALVWYWREDYPRVLEVMEDAGSLQTTWKAWLRDAERLERKLMREGFGVVRVFLAPDEFIQWCKSENLAPIGSSRSRWASVKAKEVPAAEP